MSFDDLKKPTDAEIAAVETFSLSYQAQFWDYANRRWLNQGGETGSQDFANKTKDAINKFGTGRVVEIRKDVRVV